MDLVIFDTFVRTELLTIEIFPLLQTIHPDWCTSNTILQRFENGITNQTYGIFKKDADSDKIIDESQGLLLKIYGRNTEFFLNRPQEIDVMKRLSKYGLSNRLLLLFNNGFIASYIPGRVCTCEQISSSSIASMIAKQMAKFHSVSLESNLTEATLLPQIKKFLNSFISNPSLQSEIAKDLAHIEKNIIPKLRLDIVLCHNDLLPANIIYDQINQTVSFIDFEFCSSNYWLYDIANHFGEYIDYYEYPEIDTYPSRDFRKRWLEIYLLHRSPTIQTLIWDLDQLCDLTEILTALSHLFWSLWLFVQIDLPSDNHFDCVKYAHMRFQKYLQFRTYLYKNKLNSEDSSENLC